MPEMDIDALLERELKQGQYRQKYNQREDVKERRKIYNERRREEQKIARQVLSGEVTREDAVRKIAVLRGEEAPMPSPEKSEEAADS